MLQYVNNENEFQSHDICEEDKQVSTVSPKKQQFYWLLYLFMSFVSYWEKKK